MEVYRVDSKETGELLFIAAGDDPKTDWKDQSELLKKKTHPVVLLQSHYNKYGESDLVFSTVKKVSSDKELVKVIAEAKEKKVKVQKGQVKEEVPDEVPEVTTEEIPEVEDAVVEEPEMETAVVKKRKGRRPRK